LTFLSGWNPDRARVAREGMLASGRYCRVTVTSPPPPAFSLSRYLLRPLEQGQAGTCWVHAAVCLAETSAVALGYEAFPICRRLVGTYGKRLEDGGNPTDGGSVVDAIYAMTAEKGIGIAHEDLMPYFDPSTSKRQAARILAEAPTQAAIDDAKKSHIVMPIDVTSDDQARALIASNHPVAIGEWWPYNFDDQQTFMTEIGYVQAGVWPGTHGKSAWWQIRNWHGQLYPPLSPEFAALVPGYKSDNPTTTSDFWVREDLDQTLQGYGDYEYLSATDLTGLQSAYVSPDYSGLFVV
jgi:hypothetical protein